MHRTKGFSLIEVLIAVLIFAIGLLGVASLQLFGLQQNQNSQMRTQAVILAQDMAERLRANQLGWQSGAYHGIDSRGASYSADCLGNICSMSALAEHDAREWTEAVLAELPGGRGEVRVDGAVTLVSISWRERGELADTTYELRVR